MVKRKFKKRKNECNIIDFSKAGSYKSKKWLELEEKYKKCKGKIRKWCSADGSCDEIKNKSLYIDGEKVYKWKGWGMGKGTNYESGKGKYKRSLGWLDKVRFRDLKERMKPFKVQDITKLHKRR